MKKKFMTLALTAAMAASMGMTAFAGQWVQNTTGWWWQEDNGSYPVSQWKWLDGNKDGIYECYAFDSNGYMYADTTTPDGYTVNKEGLESSSSMDGNWIFCRASSVAKIHHLPFIKSSMVPSVAPY